MEQLYELGVRLKDYVDDKVDGLETSIVEEAKVPGPKGERGPRGDPGGPVGPQGDKGDTGDKGEAGTNGDRGPEGLIGPKGDRGPKGDTGETGIRGHNGPKGDRGARGVVGPKGVPGVKGSDGSDGKNGKDGKVGPKGAAGPTGVVGPQGGTGAQGEQGTFDRDELYREVDKKVEAEFNKMQGDYNQRISNLSNRVAAFSPGSGSYSIVDMRDVEFTQLEALANNTVLVFDNTIDKFKAYPLATIINNIRADLEMQYNKQIDVVGSVTYIGESLPGTADSASLWRIKKVDETSTPDITITWAGGDENFDKVWDDRVSLSYSQD